MYACSRRSVMSAVNSRRSSGVRARPWRGPARGAREVEDFVVHLAKAPPPIVGARGLLELRVPEHGDDAVDVAAELIGRGARVRGDGDGDREGDGERKPQ